jgi:hypothetical protein
MRPSGSRSIFAFTLLIITFLLPTAVEAKWPYCDISHFCYPPYSDMNSPCTCPLSTTLAGTTTTCGSYFSGFCDGSDLEASIWSIGGGHAILCSAPPAGEVPDK